MGMGDAVRVFAERTNSGPIEGPMLSQLMLCKKLFQEGCAFAEKGNPIASGIGISFFQDSVEMYFWILAKEKNLSVKENFTFSSMMDLIVKSGIEIPYTAKIIELNKARINFKHYGILPAKEEAVKFQGYVEQFFILSSQNHFNIGFSDISLIDLIQFPEIRQQLKEAEIALAQSNDDLAAEHLAKGRAIFFQTFKPIFPPSPKGIGEIDGMFPDYAFQRFRPFHKVGELLDTYRQFMISTYLKIDPSELLFLNQFLPSAIMFGNGEWQIIKTRSTYPEKSLLRALSLLTELCLRIAPSDGANC